MTSPPLSVSLDLLVCLSSCRCSPSVRSPLPRVLHNTPSAGSRSFLICARVSHPDLPAPTSSPAWHSLLVKQSASSLDLLATISPWANLDQPSFHRQHAQRPRTKPVHHRLIALTSSASASASHRIASHCMVLRPTSTRPSLYRLWPIPLHPASRPCGLSCLTTLSTTVAEPSTCPAVQRTDRRRALLRVAAAAPAPVRPSPPSVSPLAPEPPGHLSVILCASSTTRLWNTPSRPSCAV